MSNGIHEIKKSTGRPDSVEDERVCGLFGQGGEFVAMTFTESKRFKTERGARAWLARRGVV